MQASQLGGKPRRITGPGQDGSAADSDHDSLHPGHAIDERGMQYRPDTDVDTEGLLNGMSLLVLRFVVNPDVTP